MYLFLFFRYIHCYLLILAPTVMGTIPEDGKIVFKCIRSTESHCKLILYSRIEEILSKKAHP